MNSLDIMIKITFIVMVAILAIILLICYQNNNKYYSEDNSKFKIDKDTYDISILHLEKLIKFETIYTVNAEIGNVMTQSIGASGEMSNDQIEAVNGKVQKRVIECLSDKLRDYFINNFGETWLLDYIKIYTLSMILSYSELSMTSLVYSSKEK